MNSRMRLFKLFCFVFLFFVICGTGQYSLAGEWIQFLEEPVIDMKISTIPGIDMDGLVFAISGDNGGLAYYTSPDSLSIFGFIYPLSLVSIAPDSDNNRIFCATDGHTDSDGLYVFDVAAEEFVPVFYRNAGNFVKQLPSGFYFGWGFAADQGGLVHSFDGEEWTAVDFFEDINVLNIVETADGTLFVSTAKGIFIIDYNRSEPVQLFDEETVHDIYVRRYPYNDEVYIAIGSGSYSDGVYRLDYENGEVTGTTLINYVFMAGRLYEYWDYLVVGCHNNNNTSNLFLVEPLEFAAGDVYQIGTELEINEVYSFEVLPCYCHNFAVGTDAGVFWGSNIHTSTDDTVTDVNPVKSIRNYPNPFNPATTISFELSAAGKVELTVYNTRGQKIKTIIKKYLERGKHSVGWQGDDETGNTLSSGIYFYELKVNGESSGFNKGLLLK